MAKDRFSNQKRNNYEKPIEYNRIVKRTNVFTKEQRMLLEDILIIHKDKLSNWDMDFIKQMQNSATYSQKQKEVLNKIYTKVK